MTSEAFYSQIPKVLYKYLPLQYAKQMLEEGTVKLGTLYGYRQSEYGKARSDSTEGSVKYSVKDIQENRDGTYNIKLPIRVNFNGSVNISRDQLVYSSANAYMYCVSSLKSSELMQSFTSDACIKINDSEKFFSIVTYRLADLGHILYGAPIAAGKCIYQDEGKVINNNSNINQTPEFFMKPAKYKDQYECRFLWFPQEKSSSPISDDLHLITRELPSLKPLQCPEIKEICELIEL